MPAIAVLATGILLAALPASPARADSPATLCEAATSAAAVRYGVPLATLRAIALVESGRAVAGHRRPWPWTVNAAGRGYWFETGEAAAAFARQHAAGGGVDIGCFQINTRWHGHAFTSTDAMFDPDANASYAARFLTQLRVEFGDWDAAVGAYHSRTPALAEAYRARFLGVLAGLEPEPAPPPRTRSGAAPPVQPLPQGAARASGRGGAVPAYPLVRAAGTPRPGGHGSLVGFPVAEAAQPLIRATARALR